MNDGIDSILDGMLVGWHRWTAGYRDGRGYPGVNAACRMAQSAAHRGEECSAFDESVDDDLAEAVDAAMDQVPQPHRTALAFQARNMSSRAAVWTSPRLPVDPAERTVLLLEARNFLLKVLAKRGILS
ncbi:hypothetical protein [Xylophilus sp. Leaf220]|uniref:hypothetical protein n=1 Tax=Xylophilus sp. Leaf220 TaxID=1735686 RepID=UPI000700EAD7|nr:hypothetical protein [Xylophilus sp. Leaf220]KQM79831.1 hypothetical protein ASE76_01095 [Xylophilus sp. Leaf220]